MDMVALPEVQLIAGSTTHQDQEDRQVRSDSGEGK